MELVQFGLVFFFQTDFQVDKNFRAEDVELLCSVFSAVYWCGIAEEQFFSNLNNNQQYVCTVGFENIFFTDHHQVMIKSYICII